MMAVIGTSVEANYRERYITMTRWHRDLEDEIVPANQVPVQVT
jgi:hypothetical protein